MRHSPGRVSRAVSAADLLCHPEQVPVPLWAFTISTRSKRAFVFVTSGMTWATFILLADAQTELSASLVLFHPTLICLSGKDAIANPILHVGKRKLSHN